MARRSWSASFGSRLPNKRYKSQSHETKNQRCSEEGARKCPYDAGTLPPRGNQCLDFGREQLRANHICTALKETGYSLTWSFESCFSIPRQGSPDLLRQTVLSIDS